MLVNLIILINYIINLIILQDFYKVKYLLIL